MIAASHRLLPLDVVNNHSLFGIMQIWAENNFPLVFMVSELGGIIGAQEVSNGNRDFRDMR